MSGVYVTGKISETHAIPLGVLQEYLLNTFD